MLSQYVTRQNFHQAKGNTLVIHGTANLEAPIVPS
jgi:hypothetical protein